MDKIYIIGGLILSLLISISCKQEEINSSKYEDINIKQEETETTRCVDNSECSYLDGYVWEKEKGKCENNKCIVVECIKDWDCNYFISTSFVFPIIYSDACINNTCINFRPKCEEIARLDYDMKDPHCTYDFDMKCSCVDSILIKGKTIEKANSIQIFPDRRDYTDVIHFKVKRAE